MNNSSIVFTAPNVAEVLDGPVPVPGPGRILIHTARTCISSGTERANLVGDPMIGTEVRDGAPAVFPRHLGYSASGVVESVGDGVVSVKPGDRVSMSWSCHGALQCRPEGLVYPLPENVSFEAAALTHIAIMPMQALRKCRFEFGESVLVVGQGLLGQLAVKLARAVGAAPVIAADPVPGKRERALVLGADLALDPGAPDFAERAKAATDGGARVVVEVTGVDRALDTALDAVARFGRVALLGCTRRSEFAIDYYRKVHGRGVTLVGAHNQARPAHDSSPGWWTVRDDALAYLRLVSLGRLDMSGFVEEVHPIADAPAVYARLAEGGPFPTVQFDWTDLP
jgi:threonine dehydrogenase-like Zn-dependent dehydrogenase